ncbi:MAG: biopolymer transporter ExbD [Candidatus Aenigmatarchaeota archaeon]
MKFKRRLLKEAGLTQIDIAPLIDVVFQLLIFFMLTSSFIAIPGISVKLPKAVSSEIINQQTLTIVISSEDIIYLKQNPVSLKELEDFITTNKYNTILIKADRNSSLGVVVGIYDICKKLGIEKIGIATTSED